MPSNKSLEERLDKVIKRLDIITVILLKNSGMKRKDIAEALGVSEKTIERLISVSKLKGSKGQKEINEAESEEEPPTQEESKQ